MKPKISIQMATSDHADDLVKIMSSNSDLYDPIMPGAFQKYAASIATHGMPTTYDVNMIQYEGEVVGFIGTIHVKDHMIYLLAFYLLSAYQRKGIGKTIIEELITNYKSKQISEIVLLVHKDAHWARRFYEKNNFKCVSEIPEEIKSYGDQALEKHYIRNSVLYGRIL